MLKTSLSDLCLASRVGIHCSDSRNLKGSRSKDADVRGQGTVGSKDVLQPHLFIQDSDRLTICECCHCDNNMKRFAQNLSQYEMRLKGGLD